MGQLGNNSMVDSSSPVNVSGGAVFSATGGVGAGSTLSCAPAVAAGLSCWGSDANGQLGNGGANADSFVPSAVSTIATQVADTTGGGGHGCALTGGAVYCWGDNGFGQLGNSTTVSATAPVQATGLTTATQVSAGGYHTCAATSTGIYCWGDNSMGEIGDTTTTNRNAPTAAIYP
jgi:alpha-tubulin suppressor-like RCC1 family protein